MSYFEETIPLNPNSQQQYTTFPSHQPGLIPTQTQKTVTTTVTNPVVLPNQTGLFPNQPGLIQNQPGLFQNQPGLIPNQPGLFQNQPGLMPNQPGLIPTQQYVTTTFFPTQPPPPVVIKETTTPLIIQEAPIVIEENTTPIVEEKTFLEKAKDTLQEAGEKLEDTLIQAGESINQTSDKIAPYTVMAKEILHQTGESLGIVKPAQKIEGPLSEIQDVRKGMGKTRMEQPYQKSLAERAVETWNEAGVVIGPYAEKAKDTLYEAKDALHEVGEKIGIVYPHQKIEGPLAEIQDIRKSKGKPRMDQPLWKPMDEMTYTEKTKETLIEAKESINLMGEKIAPYKEKAKESLHQAGETLGLVYPHQKIEGPLAEIQDVRKEMGKTKMEQPYQKPLSEIAKESITQASETLHQAGEKVGNIVKPNQAPLYEVPPIDLKDVQIDMGWLGPNNTEQPVQETLIEEHKETTVETLEIKDTWNETGERIELGKQMGFFNNPQNVGGSLDVQNQNIGLQQQGFNNNPQNIGVLVPQNIDFQYQNIEFQQQPQQQQIPSSILQASERMEMFAEKARQKMAMFNQVGLNNPGTQNLSQGQGLEDLRGAKAEHIVVTETTKVLPA